jgi:hypothetical protein
MLNSDKVIVTNKSHKDNLITILTNITLMLMRRKIKTKNKNL